MFKKLVYSLLLAIGIASWSPIFCLQLTKQQLLTAQSVADAAKEKAIVLLDTWKELSMKEYYAGLNLLLGGLFGVNLPCKPAILVPENDVERAAFEKTFTENLGNYIENNPRVKAVLMSAEADFREIIMAHIP